MLFSVRRCIPPTSQKVSLAALHISDAGISSVSHGSPTLSVKQLFLLLHLAALSADIAGADHVLLDHLIYDAISRHRYWCGWAA